MAPEPKRRKINQPQQSRNDHSSPTNRDRVQTPVPATNPLVTQNTLRIQQARSFAVAQAQQDNCKGNFKIFDSPFGNFFVPVVPTRSELTK